MIRGKKDARKILEREYRMQSNILRWGVTPTVRPQYLTDHVYFVTLYVSQLCDVYRKDSDFTVDALMLALRHDLTEIWSIDIPGPIKRMIIKEDGPHTLNRIMDSKVGDHCRWANPDYGDVVALVKVADLMDELAYIFMERALGNTFIDKFVPHILKRLKKACTTLEKMDSDFKGVHDLIIVELDNLEKQIHEEGALVPTDEDLEF